MPRKLEDYRLGTLFKITGTMHELGGDHYWSSPSLIDASIENAQYMWTGIAKTFMVRPTMGETVILVGFEERGSSDVAPVLVYHGRLVKTWHSYDASSFLEEFELISEPGPD